MEVIYELVRMTISSKPEFCLSIKRLIRPNECKKIISRAEYLGFQALSNQHNKVDYRKSKRVIIGDEMLHIWLFSKIITLCPEKIVTLNNVEYKLLNVNNEVKIKKTQ